MIEVQGLGKSYGARTLFADVALKLVRGARYGLVGANGSGKTTFLEILAGDEPATEGTVTIAKGTRLGVLRQDRFLDDRKPILDVAMAGDELVTSARAEQAEITASERPDAARLAELEDLVAAHDGYTLEARASAILEGLGIPIASHRMPLGTLSGGFKLRVLLAQVLLGGPDALLLDEPTNHLDILSIRWLEQFLARYEGCAVVISHDERFLDGVVNRILDVDYGTITAYTGNYSAFVKDKEETRARKEAELARAEAAIAEKRAWVERFGAKATKASQAQSRLKQIEKIEREQVSELADTSRREPRFHFEPLRPSGRDVLVVDGIHKAYGAKKVLQGVSLTVRRGERVAVIGANGLGKSTLLKIATSHLDADAGKITWGHETRVGWFPQDHREELADPEMTTLDAVGNLVPSEPTTYVRGELGRHLFGGEDVTKKVGTLSGGEAARLLFCRIAVQKPNVLVLDEPTNHLDLEAIHALTNALRAFDGTVLFVSHDRAFVSALATRVLEVTPKGFTDFPGTYDEFLAQKGDDHLDADAVVLRAKSEKEKSDEPKASALSWEEEKKRKNRKKQLPGLRDAAIAAVEAAEARKAAIHAKFCEPGFFEKTPAAEIAALQDEDKALGPKIDELMATWDALEKELAS